MQPRAASCREDDVAESSYGRRQTQIIGISQYRRLRAELNRSKQTSAEEASNGLELLKKLIGS